MTTTASRALAFAAQRWMVLIFEIFLPFLDVFGGDFVGDV